LSEDVTSENFPAERRYERWVMRVGELVHGIYPEEREEAEDKVLIRLKDGFVGNVTPTDFWGEGESTVEEVATYFSDYGEDHMEAARSMVHAVYSAVGGDEWTLIVELEGGGEKPAVRVRGVSLDLQDTWIDLIVDPNSLACKDTSDLRALHDRIVRQLPKRQLTAFEAASEALEHVEEMQAALEDVREVSDHLDVLEEIRDAQAALHDLWMALGGIAATEDPASGNEKGNA
jgi:hypothetical protein